MKHLMLIAGSIIVISLCATAAQAHGHKDNNFFDQHHMKPIHQLQEGHVHMLEPSHSKSKHWKL